MDSPERFPSLDRGQHCRPRSRERHQSPDQRAPQFKIFGLNQDVDARLYLVGRKLAHQLADHFDVPKSNSVGLDADS